MFEGAVVIRGGGDLGSGVALRLWRSGFRVAVLESAHPVAVRRRVSFSEAIYDGETRVEEAKGQRADTPEHARRMVDRGDVPVLIDPDARLVRPLGADVLVDAIMAKRNTGTRCDMADFVLGLGPGFEAGRDVDALVETNRGPDLGRVIWSGEAAPNTGEPGPVGGLTSARVLRAPTSGVLQLRRSIGDIVEEGEVVADVDGVPVAASFCGLIRGLARGGLKVQAGMKVGDIDPRPEPRLCLLVSDKALAVAGGVLEAVMMYLKRERDGRELR